MHGQDNVVKSKIIKEEREGKGVFPFVVVNLQTATLNMLKRSNHMTRSKSLSSISASSTKELPYFCHA